MPDRELVSATPGEAPSHEEVQQLIEAERGHGSQGIRRTWQASDSGTRVVLTSTSAGVQISRDNGTTAPTNVINVGTPAGGNLAGSYPNPTLSAAIIDALVPPGTVMAYAQTGVPTGWLFCNGDAVSRTTYAKLFGVIGVTWGAGDGSTTFNLPNLAGRVLLGSGGAYTFATVGGSATAPGPAHTHAAHNHGLGSHTHGPGVHTHGPGAHTHATGAHTHGMTHGHTMDHQHLVNLDHNHALAPGVAVGSGAITGVHEGPSAVVNVSASNHAHDVDVPALGLTNTTSSGTATNTADAPASGVSGGISAGALTSGTPTTDNTGTPTANDTAAATGTTNNDGASSAAGYTEMIPTLPPYAVLSYIIRSG